MDRSKVFGHSDEIDKLAKAPLLKLVKHLYTTKKISFDEFIKNVRYVLDYKNKGKS